MKLFLTALYPDDNILYFNEDSGNGVFSCNKIGIFNVDLNNINLDNNLMKIILILLFLSNFWLGIINLKNEKHLKKS